MGSKIEAVIGILFDGENISFDASVVMYINSTSIPTIMIRHWMYENQKLVYIIPLIKHTIVVGPRDGLDSSEKERISCPLPGFELRFWRTRPRSTSTIPTELSRLRQEGELHFVN
jgi:hypothetical protein